MAQLHGVKYKEAALKSKLSGGKPITTTVDKLVVDTTNTDPWLLDHGIICVLPHKGKLSVISGHRMALRLVEAQPEREVNVKLVSAYALSQAKEGTPLAPEEIATSASKLENRWRGGDGFAKVRRVGEKPRY